VRASIALERTARAWALVNGRPFVEPGDIERLFVPVIAHRLVFEAFALATEGSEETLLERARAACLERAPVPAPAWDEGRTAAAIRPA
jgi:MoxR-like ATPase